MRITEISFDLVCREGEPSSYAGRDKIRLRLRSAAAGSLELERVRGPETQNRRYDLTAAQCAALCGAFDAGGVLSLLRDAAAGKTERLPETDDFYFCVAADGLRISTHTPYPQLLRLRDEMAAAAASFAAPSYEDRYVDDGIRVDHVPLPTPQNPPFPGMGIPGAAVVPSAGWRCAGCGKTGNRGKFCPDCGAPVPWRCPGCGLAGNAGKFCTACGAPRPAQTKGGGPA